MIRRELIRYHVIGIVVIMLITIAVGSWVVFGPPLFSSRYIDPQAELKLQVADDRVVEFVSAARRFAAEHAFSTLSDFSHKYDNGTKIDLVYTRSDGVDLDVTKQSSQPRTFRVAIYALKPGAHWEKVFDDFKRMLKSDGYGQDEPPSAVEKN